MSLGELSDQLLEQELPVVEATVVGHMHGHPQAHRGQLVMENLGGNVAGSCGMLKNACLEHSTGEHNLPRLYHAKGKKNLFLVPP